MPLRTGISISIKITSRLWFSSSLFNKSEPFIEVCLTEISSKNDSFSLMVLIKKLLSSTILTFSPISNFLKQNYLFVQKLVISHLTYFYADLTNCKCFLSMVILMNVPFLGVDCIWYLALI